MRDEDRVPDVEEIKRVKKALGVTEKRWPVGFVMSMALLFGLIVTLMGCLAVWTTPRSSRS